MQIKRSGYIYATLFVEKLFDDMSKTYGILNSVCSFGFSTRWRKQFLRHAAIHPGMVVVDLMCGMGECWRDVAKYLSCQDQLIAMDFSHEMLRGALKQRARLPTLQITITKQNILANGLGDACVDCVICAYGIKTLSDQDVCTFAAEIHRLLKPNGTFSLVEVSSPNGLWLKRAYLLYLKHVVPILGRIFLGNPENYRMLGLYTEYFGDCRRLCDALSSYGMRIQYHDYFFGCASGVSGVKLK